MENIYAKEASIDFPAPKLEGLTEQEARQFKEILTRFMASYRKKGDEVTDQEWLKTRFQEEFPDLSPEEAQRMSEEVAVSVAEYDANLAEIKAAAAKGKSKEQWFADKAQEASAGMAVAEYGRKLGQIDQVLQKANEQMQDTILRLDGEVSQQLNLDGFIAEQAHVNSFNEAAALAGEPYFAEVRGSTAKNSFDVVIKDTRTGRIVHQYQMKYGADAKSTIAMIRRGDYHNQILVVPPDQVDAVKAAFPGKTVVACIGGTGKIHVSSSAMTKDMAKELQKKAQEKGLLPEENWNSYNTRELALQLGKNAALAGMQGAMIGTGFHLARQVFAGEEIDPDETIEVALETGADAGVKSATAGAIKVASEKEILKVIPKNTPIGVIANIACVAVENVKILGKAATGELTMAECLDQMGQTTVSMYHGLSWSPAGMALGAAALSWVPVVGPVVGGLAGGALGYMAGSKFGETLYKGVKKVVTTGVNIVKSVGRKVIDTGRKVLSKIPLLGRFFD